MKVMRNCLLPHILLKVELSKTRNGAVRLEDEIGEREGEKSRNGLGMVGLRSAIAYLGSR